MKIPLREAIHSAAWYHCRVEKCLYYVEGLDAFDFRVRVISFEKLDLKQIDDPHEIEIDTEDGVLWILKFEVVNMSKKALSTSIIRCCLVLKDSDDFEFGAVDDNHIKDSDYGKSVGLSYKELMPKIKTKGAVIFLLPKDEAEYFLSVTQSGDIKEV